MAALPQDAACHVGTDQVEELVAAAGQDGADREQSTDPKPSGTQRARRTKPTPASTREN
jgi:hypothetical protein